MEGDREACLDWSLKKPKGCRCSIVAPRDASGRYIVWERDERCPVRREEHNASVGVLSVASR